MEWECPIWLAMAISARTSVSENERELFEVEEEWANLAIKLINLVAVWVKPPNDSMMKGMKVACWERQWSEYLMSFAVSTFCAHFSGPFLARERWEEARGWTIETLLYYSTGNNNDRKLSVIQSQLFILLFQ